MNFQATTTSASIHCSMFETLRIDAKRLFLILIITLSICGCIAPMRFEGYVPSGEGELLDSPIRGITEAMRITIGDAHLVTWARFLAELLTVGIVVHVPAGVTAQFVTTKFFVRSPELEDTVVLDILRIDTSGPKQLAATAELYGETYNSLFETTYRLDFPRFRGHQLKQLS